MKPYTLTNREGESISPMTSTRTVLDERGVDLDTLLEQQRQDAGNALKDYAKKTEVTQGLAGKQNKLTPTTDLHITDDNIIGMTDMAKKRLFIDMWNEACGQYGKYDPENAPDPEYPFYLNELWLTYDEAVTVYLDGTFNSKSSGGKRFSNRTNMPITAYHAIGTIVDSFDSDAFVMNVEVANLKSIYSSMGFSAYPISIYNKPFGYAKLRMIIGDIDFHFAKATINWFVGAVNLEEVSITRLAFSINLSSCGKLNLQSFQTMIVKADSDNDSGIHPRVITVHPDVYAKLTGDTTNAAASALTEEELAQWQQLLVDAAEKQIIFATT